MGARVIRSATVVSMDDRVGDHTEADILIEGSRIAAIGPGLQVPEGAEVIDGRGRIAMPGFVNAHIHTWQTGLRGVAADWTIPRYLRAMHAGLATHFTPDDIRIANHVGALHQIHAGTTTLADWCHNNPTPAHTDGAIDGLEAAGIRAVFLHGSPKPDPKPGQPHFSEIPMPRGEVERLRGGRLGDDQALVTMGLAVLGPQMAVQAVCDADLALARDLDLVASMHVSGNMLTPEGFVELERQGLLGPKINIVHGNALSDEALKRLVDLGVSFSLTPEVELQMGFGNPLTLRLRAMGGPISVGSDVESDMGGDMFAVTRAALQAARHEANLAYRAEHGVAPDEMAVSAREALEWATIGGARMLGLEDRVGSLAPGKQADIVLLDATAINLVPVHDPVASILFHAGPQNVEEVLIAGVTVKTRGRLVAPDLEARLGELAQSGLRIIEAFEGSQRA